MNLIEKLKNSISTIYAKYINQNEEIEALPIFYIGGSQTLPPPLTPEEEQEILDRIEKGEKEARKVLVERNLRLVVYIAKKFENTGVGLEDLISIGTIGLMKGVNTFKVDKKIKLATYASRCIENEILMHIRSNKKRKDTLSLYSPIGEDKEGNEIYTKYDKDKNAVLYIKKDNKEYQLQKEDETDNYYIEKNGDKEYVELNSVPLVAKVDMKANTVITKDLISKSDNTVADDVRREEYNVFVLPMDLATGDYIDVRLMLPSGQNYIVVAKKEVTIPNIAGADSEDTVWLNLREDEILSISSAIVDAARINGAKLYVTKYTEAGMQKAATPTYVVSSETAALMNKDPNILDKAMKELKSRYENIGSTEIRNNYINRAIDNAGEEGETNLKTNMEESITKSQENRKKYLDSLSGAVQ